jgi:hypothetical protein
VHASETVNVPGEPPQSRRCGANRTRRSSSAGLQRDGPGGRVRERRLDRRRHGCVDFSAAAAARRGQADGRHNPADAGQPLLLVDAGANVDCKPHHLLQFARLGSIYVEDVWQRPSPRVGLLNIGEEPEKGDELAVEAHGLLASSGLNFVGNVEGRDVIRGTCDVLVADGFVGNVLLKFYESVTDFIHGMLREELERAGATRPAADLQATSTTRTMAARRCSA